MPNALTVSGGSLQNYLRTPEELMQRANDVIAGIRAGWLKLTGPFGCRCLSNRPCFRFQIPLVKPNVQLSRIRFRRRWLMRSPTQGIRRARPGLLRHLNPDSERAVERTRSSSGRMITYPATAVGSAQNPPRSRHQLRTLPHPRSGRTKEDHPSPRSTPIVKELS
jgi:hypothetical protein